MFVLQGILLHHMKVGNPTTTSCVGHSHLLCYVCCLMRVRRPPWSFSTSVKVMRVKESGLCVPREEAAQKLVVGGEMAPVWLLTTNQE